MKFKILILSFIASGIVGVKSAHAQFVVTDPTNLVQSIVNSTNEIIETTTTAERMLSNFKETVKIYEQGRDYYDKLRSVNNLVQNARKVQQTILMLGEISDIYINNYGKMLQDPNYSTEELSSIASGYNKLMSRGSGIVAELKSVVNPTDMSMTDKERLDLVDRAHREMTDCRNLTQYYTHKNIAVAYLRSRSSEDEDSVMRLYGNDERYW